MAEYTAREWSNGDIVTAANLSSIERGVSAVAEEYTPTTWANGNTVTAAALNNIEQGIANAGGGGSSDFSTAEVTIINTTNRQIPFHFAFVESFDSSYTTAFYIDSESGVSIDRDVDVGASTSLIQEVYIQDDKSIALQPLVATAGRTYTISGNVVETTYEDSPLFTITGDCTITIS